MVVRWLSHLVIQKDQGIQVEEEIHLCKNDKSCLWNTTGSYHLLQKVAKHLQDKDFVCNDYDMCTFNKMVNGNQLTIQFHVDDLKASHHDPDVLRDIVNWLRKEFGKEHQLTENIGKLHDYLGIIINYSIKGKLVLTMFDYLEDIIVECPNDLKKATPIFQPMIVCSSSTKITTNWQQEKWFISSNYCKTFICS